MTVTEPVRFRAPKRRDAAARFEEEYAAFRRQKTLYNILLWGVFIACIVAAAITAKFDVVTLLEVLEHIPDTVVALSEVCRVARRFVVLSVPSKLDNNPEHIHLFDAAQLEIVLHRIGVGNVSFTYVPGHLIAVARIAQ